MTKCIYCDFDNPEHRGTDFYSNKRIDIDKALNNVEGTEYQFLELKPSEEYPILRFIHSDPDGWSNEDDEVCDCKYCLRCGRDLSKEYLKYENNRQD